MSAMTLAALKESVRGEALAPGDAGYEDARLVHNGMIDRRPGVVVRVANAGDVMMVVNYARENDLALRSAAAGIVPRDLAPSTTGWSSTSPRCAASASILRLRPREPTAV